MGGGNAGPGASGGPGAHGVSGGPAGGVRGLIGDTELESSPVVANRTMNRGRGLAGVNGYDRELGLDVLGVLRERLAAVGRASWLDLCCGEGRAVIQGAAELAASVVPFDETSSGMPPGGLLDTLPGALLGPLSGTLAGLVTVVGVDLVEAFALPGTLPPGLELVAASVTDWRPPAGRTFDLISCVHGLHYLGDKLGLLERAAAWTAPGGIFAATFDPAGVRHAGDRRSAARRVLRVLRDAGATYDARRHLLTWHGPTSLDFGARYAGADPGAGFGYVGIETVDSCYTWE